MSNDNEQLVLISGASATGKSASLQNIVDQDKWLYLNCEAGKRLPFKNNFVSKKIVDPYQIFEAFTYAAANPGKFKGIIIDTLTFLMDMFESNYVLGTADTMKGWSNYQQYFKELMQVHIASTDLPVIIFAHTRADYNEKTLNTEVAVPIKGALRNNGIEAYFSTVVSTKKVSVDGLEKYPNDLLTITERDKALGYKHVFQTMLTKETKDERIRSPMGMFSDKETYINNDSQLLLDHLKKYYTV